MTSSKFSRHAHAMRVPDVCKKKLEPEEEECSYDPQEILENYYNVDVSWFIYHYVFSGMIILENYALNNWKTPTPPPANGQWGMFNHFPATEQFSAQLQHWVGGVQKLGINITGAPLPHNCPFNTEQFSYTSAIWQGMKFGRIYNG